MSDVLHRMTEIDPPFRNNAAQHRAAGYSVTNPLGVLAMPTTSGFSDFVCVSNLCLLVPPSPHSIVAKLTAQRQRSWVERDLQRGDLSFLTDFAFFRNRRPPSAVVDRLRERGFLAETARGRSRMTLKGRIAILLRGSAGKSRPRRV